MKYASVCSGIEGATLAWQSLGWESVFVSEIEPFPAAVLAHHYPDVPNRGDMTLYREWPDANFDVLVGGTPCQSFSVAGLRAGLADPRGNLALVFLGILDRFRPRWVVWENVPGVLSSWSDETPRDLSRLRVGDEGEVFQRNDFDTFTCALRELGYGVAWSVLDAQYFGLAQRRERVFVVGCFGDESRAAAVLFDRTCLSGHPAPRRETWENVALPITGRVDRGGEHREAHSNNLVAGAIGARTGQSRGVLDAASGHMVAHALGTKWHSEPESSRDNDVIAHALRADGFDAGEDGTGRGTPLVIASPLLAGGRETGPHGALDGVNLIAGTLTGSDGGMDVDRAIGNQIVPVAFDARQSDVLMYGQKTGPLDTDPGSIAVAFSWQQAGDHTTSMNVHDTAPSLVKNQTPATQYGMSVRRLTPTECERLQGVRDGYTDIPFRGKPAADGPRYKALGNGFAVPVVRWIGERIQMVTDLAPLP